ncbi:neuraminidase-like domain-containing protein [Streptomyces pseudogriseolus]|uniref:Tc toxin subunit A-related protein n=1 Tax=Streptomyces pseudogriseolus TaxID=36817 RepID=UPI003FA22D83
MPAERSYLITGTITDSKGNPLPDALVRASGPGQGHQDSPLGEAFTESTGRYRIRVDEDSSDPHTHVATVIIKVLIDGVVVGTSKPNRKQAPETVISLRTGFQPPTPAQRTVSGIVRDQFGQAMKNVIVQAFDRDLRTEQSLGQKAVDQDGRYEISYTDNMFNAAEKGSADLVLVVVKAGTVLFRSPVHYNAPADYEVNLSLEGAVYSGPAEWEVQTGAITPLLGTLRPIDLREDQQHQDVSFLVGETGYTALEIGTWVACWRLADRTQRDGTPLPAEAFFAFLRQGEPSIFRESLLTDVQHPERIILMEDALLRALSGMDPQRQRDLLVKALDDNLVPANLRTRIDEFLGKLASIKLKYTADITVGGGKGTIGQLLNVANVPPDQRNTILTAMSNHTGSLAELWKRLDADPSLPDTTVKKVRTAVELGSLSRNHVPLVKVLADDINNGRLTKRDLAQYSKANWFAVFARPLDGGTVGVPDNIDGATPEEKKETYAAILDQQFERAYPTASLAAKIVRSASPAEQLSRRVARFLDDHPDFHLDRFRIDHYLAEHSSSSGGDGQRQDRPAAAQPDPELLAELASVQRVFKLNPTFRAANALLSRSIDSAQQIYFMGEGQFVSALAESPVNRIEARRIYRRAENAYALALTTFADYNRALTGTLPAALPSPPATPESELLTRALPSPQAELEREPQPRALPSLQTLIGSLDYCDCPACRSVYSPAAHFVDILRFLGDRGTQGTGPHSGKTVLQVLLERRPDLGNVELSCENTNTTVPYIDLVNEILEDVVTPPALVVLDPAIEPKLVEGPITPEVLAELRTKAVAISDDARVYAPDSRGRWVIRDSTHSYSVFHRGAALCLRATRQTTGSADEVRANPEYLNLLAYTKLAGEVFPFSLPFNLANEQSRGYLEQLGVPQPRLFELFQQSSPDGATKTPTDAQVDCALLRIGDVERKVLSGTLGRQPWEYWGLAETGNSIPHPDMPADPTQSVTGTWIEVLAKVPVMLHRTKLSYRDLVQLLETRWIDPANTITILEPADPNAAACDTSSFTIGGLTADALGRIHRFVRLWRRLGIPMWELDRYLAAWPLNDTGLRGIASIRRLRERTGLDWSTLVTLFAGFDDHEYVDHAADGGIPVQTVYQRLFRNRLVDATGGFPPRAADLGGRIGQRVPGLLAGLRLSESDLGLILADRSLSFESVLNAGVLAELHRITVLSRGLGLTVGEFLRLRKMWGSDPFASPATVVQFSSLVDQVKSSAFSVADLDYLLTHHFTVNTGIALEDRTILAFLNQLRQGLAEIADRLARQKDETDADYVATRLGLVPTLAADADLVTALALVNGSWTGTTIEREALIDRYFGALFNDLTEAHAKLAALPAGETPAKRQERIDARFAFVMPQLQAFLLRTQKDLYVDQQVAALLGIDELCATTALTRLRLPGSTTDLRRVINDPRLLVTASDGSFQFPLDELTFPDIYKALRLLHKVAILVGKLNMKPGEVSWWLSGDQSGRLGWIRADMLGVDQSTIVAIGRWTAMQWFFDWKSQLPASSLSALDFADELLSPTAPSTATINALAKLTAWRAEDITALATAFGWLASAGVDQVKAQLAKAENLRRVVYCMTSLPRLGVEAKRAVAWADATPSAAIADEIKQALKARYELPQWLEANQPVQDALRERRRDVLVDWLVAHPDPLQGQHWTDTNGLYSHLLIDVEMSACALTSRLKQATGSAQLFVQRVLLNLEADIVASTVKDPKWKQWQWMRRYRVWEANRKVFLYPENWIEPELRDEKSLFFVDLENELQQNDVTAETVEQAYREYLEKLDKVANLEIRAMYEERIGDESVLHVVGRTRSSKGAEYFYRTRVNRARWTPWQPVGLEIQSEHLTLGMHNRRLYMFWPQFLEKATVRDLVETPKAGSYFFLPRPEKYWDVQLYWSELKQGKWTPKVLSDIPMTVSRLATAVFEVDRITFRTRTAPQIRACLFTSPVPDWLAPNGKDYFEKLGPQITPGEAALAEHLVSPPNSRFSGNLIQHLDPPQYFYYSSEIDSPKDEPHRIESHSNAEPIVLLQNIVPKRTWTVIDSQALGFAGTGSFFTWDPARTYFVDYDHRTYWTYFSRAWHNWSISSFRFQPHYHPFVELFIKELNTWGLPGLLNRRIQVSPETVPGSAKPFEFATYQPNNNTVARPWPTEKVDFDYEGAYAAYNWELFFHVPMFIAGKLTANQRFEEALEWYHAVFNPTSTDTATADPDSPQQKFWITKPFYETTKAEYYQQKIEKILEVIAQGDAELQAQVAEWRDHPFNPHLIARMRRVAYQKNVLIKYIQTLIAWGDQLFGQETIESNNEATQLYVLAATVLGPRPKNVPRRVPNPVRTFFQLQAAGIDVFGNALRQVENLLPGVPAPSAPVPDGPELPRLDVLYFGIPTNEKLLTLWYTVDDRLFKIRHCMSIAGQVRQLPLFEPPIDPALLVKATAAGLDIGAALSDISAPMPAYRFSVMLQRAQEVCSTVSNLGAAMLSALEKRDVEAFTALRSSHEIALLDLLRDVRNSQVAEAQAALEASRRSRDIVELRQAYHQRLLKEGLNTGENTALALSGVSLGLETAIGVGYILSGGLKLIPTLLAGAAGFGGTPTVSASTGGEQIGGSAEMLISTLRSLSTAADKGASMASVLAGHARRAQDWEHQRAIAAAELPQIDQQILAAEIRHQIAEQELHHHDRQRTNAAAEDEFQRTKFTNKELYDWMVGQLSAVYFQSYQLAFDLAKRAERCFRHELGLSDSNYVRYGYWDSLRKGLLAGERLGHDLRRLDAAYLELHKREYELTKHISLAELDPVALLQLKTNGECFIDIPEAIFDLDHPGHYFRRLKTVSLSVPCVVGPYGTVGCTLTLTANSLRKDASLLNGRYPRQASGETRFRDGVTAVQSIATSSAVNDAGVFDLRFDDQRYLPFEGSGAISSWHLRLNSEIARFDTDSISDVVIHLQYTAREGGGLLRTEALKDIDKTLSSVALAGGRNGLYRVLDLKREFPDEFYRFGHPANPTDDQAIELADLIERLPAFTRAFATKKVRRVEIAARMQDTATYEVQLAPLGTGPGDLLTLAPDSTYRGMHRASKDLTGHEAPMTGWTVKVRKAGVPDFHSLPADAVDELFLILNYEVD